MATLDPNRMRSFQRKALLAYLNVPRYELTSIKTKEAAVQRLREESQKQPERYEAGVQSIVYGRTPATSAASQDVVKEFEQRMLALMKDFNADEASQIALKQVTELTDRLRKELADEAKRALKQAAEAYRPIVIQEGQKTRKVSGVLPPEFQRMVQLGNQRVPIMLVGPAGCGKTYLSEKLAEALGLSYSDQSCSEGMSEAVFNGKLLPTGKGGAYEHHASPFMIRYEKGGVMLLDEVDASDSNLMTYANKAIANNSYTAVQRYAKPVVKKHADFVIICAANTYGSGGDAMYVGRNQLDAATLDRFKIGMIPMDYSQDVELSIGGEELCDWAWKVRAKIRENKLRRIMSTRVIKDLATMTAAYKWTAKEWGEAYFTGWTQAERNLVGV